MAPLPLRSRPRAPRAPRALALLLLAATAACSDPVAVLDQGGVAEEQLNLGTLQARASSAIVGAPVPGGPAVLRTVVTLTNRGAWPIDLRYPACPLYVTGHRLAARSDAPVFVYPGAAPFTDRGACIGAMVDVTIAPGASHVLVAAADLPALRAVVPAGRWYLRADVQLGAATGGAAYTIAAGDVTF